jgi:uncharacterized membrane protein HdeD (DUF308 family)
METVFFIIEVILKLVVGLGILNVWLLRRNQPSEWRGGNADNMQEEFKAYGLPQSAVIVVGTLKCALAVLLLFSIFYAPLEKVAAYGIAILMVGAIVMHIKIGDEVKKSLPAFILLSLSMIISFID